MVKKTAGVPGRRTVDGKLPAGEHSPIVSFAISPKLDRYLKMQARKDKRRKQSDRRWNGNFSRMMRELVEHAKETGFFDG